MNTYKKLSNGEWGVLCEERPAPGDEVVVTKKNGGTRAEKIRNTQPGRDKSTAGKWICAIETVSGGVCANCGSNRANRVSRTDSSGLTGMVCQACSRETRDCLSFG